MSTTVTTLFSGYGLADCGFKNAGFELKGAVEYKPELAAVYAKNHGDHVTVADIRHVDFRKMERPDWVHGSPVCTNASVANSNGGETELDRECAHAMMRAVDLWRPEVVSVENVYGYRHFDSFEIIVSELKRMGYGVNFWHLNSADFGVPQTRKRLILLAYKNGKRPSKPPATHAENPVENLFGCLERWNGWYGAIEDILDTLPESKFAPWQLERMGALRELAETTYCNISNTVNGGVFRTVNEPAATVTSSDHRRPSTAPRVFLFESANSSREMTLRDRDQPAITVCANDAKCPKRAYLVDGTQPQYGADLTVRAAESPAQTVTAQRESAHPTKSHLETGRVVAMTPRALGRFQTLPDWYELSGHRKTDCIGIGNGVPSLLMQRIAEHVRGERCLD